MNPSTHLHDTARQNAGHPHAHGAHSPVAMSPINSVLGWPAWQRVLAVLPLLLLMWLAVWWTSAEVAPW
ncbi:hypothetical protein [Rhodoferax sp.]|uniref:hypothetical protein n=1 Tax=Rhodoferax sp. TaxID=50421 RepID=UPI00284F80CB|nr:hypothetical protein [Rhodoferax sp.]MDR3370764.1 hypothetical protein [Rhodoferax sp.]